MLTININSEFRDTCFYVYSICLERGSARPARLDRLARTRPQPPARRPSGSRAARGAPLWGRHRRLQACSRAAARALREFGGLCARLGEHDQARAYAAEAVRLKPHFTIAAYVMTLPYKDEADRVRETGPALEGMYQFMTWLVPAVEKLPRSQKFWPYGAGRCAWGRPGTVVMRRPLWSFGEARRAPVLPHPGSSFDRRTSPLSFRSPETFVDLSTSPMGQLRTLATHRDPEGRRAGGCGRVRAERSKRAGRAEPRSRQT